MANGRPPIGLTIEQRMTIRYAVVDIIGAPWRLLGRDPKTGLDCLGMVLWLYGEAGIVLPDPALSQGTLEDAPQLAAHFSALQNDYLRELGDVIQFPTGRFGTHLAIHLDGNLLQATEEHGVVQVPFKRFIALRSGINLDWYRYAGTPRLEAAAA